MAERTPDRQALAVLLFMALAQGLQAFVLPGWVLAWCGLALLAGVGNALGRLPRIPRWVRIGLVLAGVAGVWGTGGEVWRIEFGASVLAVLTGVKALELDHHRDKLSALFLSLFLAVSGALRSPGLGVALGLVPVALAALAALAAFGCAVRPAERPPGRMRLAGVLFLAALPLAAVLFLFFPRFSAGVAPLPPPGSLSGISDHLAPGELSQIARNLAPAFRAEFEGPAPPPSRLYWRCLTLARYDGVQWTRGVTSALPLPLERDASPVGYAVTLEPHWNTWLPALDLPRAAPEAALLTGDRSLASRSVVRERRRYRVESALDFATAAPPRVPEWALALPPAGNPRARELGRRLAAEYPAPANRAAAVISLFASGDFRYTLSPPPLGQDQVDDFLFASRSGYCGHYASSAAFLLRAAGVPARIVVGYLGGEENRLGGYWLVRQSHAHTWVEALLPGTGWTRLDPTLAVAPERADIGPEAGLSAEDLENLRPTSHFGIPPELWNELSLGWDALAYRTDPWLADYDLAAQEALLRRAGLAPRTWPGRAVGLAVGLGLALLAGLLLRPVLARLGAGRPDPAVALYARFCARLADIGLPRLPHQGPLDYARGVAARRPDLAADAVAIARLYAGLRYGRDPLPGDLGELRRRVRSFRPGPMERT